MQREQFSRPFDEARPQLQQTLKRAKIQQARQEYSAHLRDQAKVAIPLSPPRVPKWDLIRRECAAVPKRR
jgi:hypothetical protein